MLSSTPGKSSTAAHANEITATRSATAFNDKAAGKVRQPNLTNQRINPIETANPATAKAPDPTMLLL